MAYDRRTRASIAGLLVAAVLLLAGDLAVARAGTSRPPSRTPSRLQILSPTQRLTTGARLTLRVRVPAGARLRATVNAVDVTAGFGAPNGGVRVARLGIGKVLRAGFNTVSVRAVRGRHRWFASRTVVMAPHERPAPAIGSGPRQQAFSGLAGVRSVLPIVMGALGPGPERARHVIARLNGRGVGYAFATRFGTLGSGRLGADDGLHFGRNRLTVTAYSDDGRFYRQTRTLRVLRNAPLLATPANRSTAVGSPVGVSVRGSRPARPGDALRYRWRIVVRPKGSRARLRDARSARPTLVPDRRGRYVLRLRTIEPGRARTGSTHAAKAGDAAASGSTALSASTSMQVLVSSLVGPLGVPVSTIGAAGGGVQIGTTSAGNYPSSSNAWAQVVVVNRATLAPVNLPEPGIASQGAGNYLFTSAAQASALRTLVTPSKSGIGPSDLVIVTGGGHAAKLQREQWQALSFAFGQLGGTMRTFAGNGKGKSDPGFGAGAWSLIGVPGLTEGTAAQNDGLASAGGPTGSLNGRLMRDSANNYDFLAGAYQPFDTNSTGQKARSGGGNTITVGGSSYASKSVTAGQSGFQVVALDAGTLHEVANETFVTNDASGQDVAGVQAMTKLLTTPPVAHSGQGVVFVVQSIGAPSPLSTAWTGSLAQAIAAIGGSADAFNDLVGTGSDFGYALVGGIGLAADQTAEQAFDPQNPQLESPPARLNGLFKRNDQYQFYPSGTSSLEGNGTNGFDLSALPLAFEPNQDDWPTDRTTAERAAQAYVAQQVFYPDRTSGYEIHTYYWQADWVHSASTYASALTNVCPQGRSPRAPRGAGFSSAVLRTVCTELHREFVWVQALWGMEGAFQSAFVQQEISGQSNASQIADGIVDALKKQQASSNSELLADVLLIEGTLTEVASEVAFAATAGNEAGGPALTVLGSSLGIMSGLLDMGVDLANTPGGEPDLSAYDTEAKNLGYAIVDQYKSAISNSDELVELLVSDYAKLSVAGPKAQDPNTWGLGQPELGAFTQSLRLSTTRYIWTKLLPVGFRVVRLGPGGDQWLQQGQGTWTPNSYRCYNNINGEPGGPVINPWRGTPASAWINQTVGIAHGKPYRRPVLLGSSKTKFSGSESGSNHVIYGYAGSPPPSSFTNTLFAPVGLEQFSQDDQPLNQLGLSPAEVFSPTAGFKQVAAAC